MAATKTTRKWLSGILVSALLSLTVGLGCGGAADLSPDDCCKNMCRHERDANDARKCCQENQQSRSSLSAVLTDVTLAKKPSDFVLLAAAPVLDGLFDLVLIEQTSVSPPKILKFPQQELYKLTSAFLI
ncbi:MAG: hypothetical protein AB1898_08475 [Acidobacteriota bacterium]